MSLTYASYYAAIQTLVASQSPDTPFDTIFPDAIDYAEQRCYRELDLLQTVTVDTSVTLAAGARNATIPSAFVVINGYNILTPVGSGATGLRNPLTPVSRDVIDMLWPGGTTATGMPVMFAQLTQWTVLFGPTPDQGYTLEIIGTQRPAPLTSTNDTTFLTLYLPDLFIAATMVFMSGYMRNFSSSGNDPQMAVNWESQYKALFASANSEEMRKKFNSSGWASLNPAPAATQPR